MRVSTIVRSGALACIGIDAGLAAFSSVSAHSADQPLPPKGRFIDADGARLHYLDVGLALAIATVHGLTEQLRNRIYALTDRLVTDYRMIVVDRPGAGYLALYRPGGRGLVAQVASIGHLVTALSLSRPSLVGHSLGGTTALKLTNKRPEQVELRK